MMFSYWEDKENVVRKDRGIFEILGLKKDFGKNLKWIVD